jgi:hypothetical protein
MTLLLVRRPSEHTVEANSSRFRSPRRQGTSPDENFDQQGQPEVGPADFYDQPPDMTTDAVCNVSKTLFDSRGV